MADIVRFGGLAVLLVLAFIAVGSAYTGSAVHLSATEDVTVDYNDSSTVDNASIAVTIFDNETVRNESGTVLTEGTDYEFWTDNGSLTWSNTTATTEGETATIAYNFTAPDAQSRDLALVMRYGFFAAILSLVGMSVVAVSKWLPSGGGR